MPDPPPDDDIGTTCPTCLVVVARIMRGRDPEQVAE